MTPDQEKQFREMYQWFKNMQASHSIPLATDQALRERLKLETLKVTGTGNANAETQTTIMTTPADITYPANPSGTVILEDSDGNTYECLLK